jgi:hypothetical protein
MHNAHVDAPFCTFLVFKGSSKKCRVVGFGSRIRKVANIQKTGRFVKGGEGMAGKLWSKSATVTGTSPLIAFPAFFGTKHETDVSSHAADC